MPQLRLMGSDVDQVQETAAAVVRALQASGEVQVGDVSVVPNKRGPGTRVYIEVLLCPVAGPTVTVERADRPAPRSGSRALPGTGELRIER
ncbi:hypothetical protein [Streptacidiphilus sp. MAP5-52]|uniref:hypothetical protein n=1 Tax=Streptacidiphilus sp. MAP5-52 TaxID=3156267 RepID=UPI0035179A4E